MTTKNKTCAIGLDIGGSKIAGVLFDGHRVIADYTLGTPRDNFNHFLIMLKAVVDPLLEAARKHKIKPAGLGLGVAGIIDQEKGRVLKSPNIAYLDGRQITAEVEKITGLPVKLDNDANCFVRAEAGIGVGAKFNNVFGLTLGTGIGGGWWMDGKIYKGARGAASEAGHLLIDRGEKIDLEEAYHRLMQNNPAKLAEEAYRGDRLAQKAYEEFGDCLGLVLTNIINLIDPQIIILGGSVAVSTDLFLSSAKKIISDYAVSPQGKKIKIATGKLGDLAGAIGAAMLIM